MILCHYCQKEFIGRKSSSRFCSRQCYWNSNIVFLVCDTCKKSFKRKSHGISKYCSKECKLNGNWGKVNKTLNIGRKHSEETKSKKSEISKKLKTWEILFKPEVRKRALLASKKTLTSRQSPLRGRSAFWLKGENNPNWKGGITTSSLKDRIYFRNTIQKEVFKRDGYKCQMCGSNNRLQVDHIQSWSEYIELRFDINNCRTLCERCHYKVTFGRPMPKNVKTWGMNFSQIQKKGGY